MTFTIIVPAYNVENYIEKTLKSLENQSYQNFEVLIIDDDSKDNTAEVIDHFVSRNKTWKYFKKSNGNWGSVINYVIQNDLIQGEYVTVLDSDDWFMSNTLEKAYQIFLKDSLIDALIVDHYKITLEGKLTRTWAIPFKSKYVNKIQALGPKCGPLSKFYKTSLFKQLPHIPEQKSFMDLFVFTFLINHAKRIYYNNKPTAYYLSNRPDNSSMQVKSSEHQIKYWDDFFSAYQISDLVSEENREVAGIFLLVLYAQKSQLKKFKQTNQVPIISIKTKGAKLRWLPWYVRMFPIKTFLKLSTKDLWQERQ